MYTRGSRGHAPGKLWPALEERPSLRGLCCRCGSKACLIYKETTLSNNLCNRSCRQLSSLYTDLHELHLPETHMHIVNKQMQTCFLLNHKHHTQQPPTLRNLMHTEWGTCDTWDGLMCEHQNKHTHTTLTHFLSLYMHRVSSLRSLGIFIKYSNALS